MKKLLVLLLLSSSVAYGQRGFTIDETVYGPSKFAPKTLTAAKWIKDADAFSNLDSTSQNLLAREAKNNWTPVQLASTNDILNALKEIAANDKFSLRSFPSNYSWIDKENIKLNIRAEKNSYNISYNVNSKKSETQCYATQQ